MNMLSNVRVGTRLAAGFLIGIVLLLVLRFAPRGLIPEK